MPRRPYALTAAAVAALTILSTGCTAGTTEAEAGAEAAAPGFPYTVTNCGVTTTFQAPPQRAVTMNQHVTEIMLELGLEKSMVGTAYRDDRLLPRYDTAYRSIPVIAEEYPSKEKLLSVAPDFVYGGWDSAFSAKDGRSRDELKATGIDTRLNHEDCLPGNASMDDLYREVEEVGRTFGVADRARKWTAQARTTVAAATAEAEDARPVPVFVYDSGDKTAFTAGGKGIGNDIITRAGGRNVFADLDKSFGDATWEQVVARKPETIVIYDYGSTTVEQKKRRLLDDPALRNVPAIRNRSFAVLALSDTVLGVRVPDAVTELARQLHPGPKR